eukprot:CAMPEP_0197652598 /NCGR_PEP_ID=MMETSP1338-20131121/34550_1 /TAXON_ID=43686 ORGANISM="Pelagodinium beii, Strain RCC1491" /NCGR_SAMPLE_ID=MMETSP1338 /ASSEMBLY_ACC=CAM_ASM_000754 /LENGTH=444 /DNA_ID=CAMNT_0043227513 /DNA_START=46 /DNA_END=1379 /DNA_ORIENTATION=+
MAGSSAAALRHARSASAKDLFAPDGGRTPPPPLRRSTSVDPRSRSASPETPRCKGMTPFSSRMSSGTGVRQALSHSPDSRRSPRRVNSVPRLLQLQGEESPDADESSFASGLSSVRSVDSLWQGYPMQTSRSSLGRRRTKRSAQSECQSTLTGYGERSSHSSLQASPRLHGFGQVVGARAKSSVDIPFRHIPSYNAAGKLCQTGDRTLQTPTRPSRKVGTFSPRLSPGNGVKDLLAPVRENVAHVQTTQPVAFCEMAEKENTATGREAWLELVRRRALTKRERLHNPPVSDAVPTVAVADTTPLKSSPPEDRRGLHHVYRAPKKGISLDFNTKDTCPYDRFDSDADSRTVQPVTPQKRGPKPVYQVSPCSSPKQQERELLSPPPQAWARRDFKFQQELSVCKVRDGLELALALLCEHRAIFPWQSKEPPVQELLPQEFVLGTAA